MLDPAEEEYNKGKVNTDQVSPDGAIISFQADEADNRFCCSCAAMTQYKGTVYSSDDNDDAE